VRNSACVALTLFTLSLSSTAAEDPKPRTTLRGMNGGIRFVGFSPDGKTLTTVTSDRTIQEWDLASEESRVLLKGFTPPGGVELAARSKDGKRMALRLRFPFERAVEVWQLDQGKRFRGLSREDAGFNALALSPDGDTLVADGPARGAVTLWSVTREERVRTLEGHLGMVGSAAFSPDGDALATGDTILERGKVVASEIKLWDLAKKMDSATLKGHGSRILALCFSPDGKLLASGSSDRTVRMWDCAGKKVIATLKGHAESVRSVAFSSDGKLLLTTSGELNKGGGTMKLWDVKKQECVATLELGAGFLTPVCLSPDCKTVAVGGHEVVRLWDVAALLKSN
jgi:WD40 repeat protein